MKPKLAVTNDNLPPRMTAEALAAILEKRGGGGNSGGMDDILRRVTAVESDMKDVKGILGRMMPMLERIEGRFVKLETDVARLDGKLSQLPTLQQIITTMLATIGGIVACAGLLVALVKYAATP